MASRAKVIDHPLGPLREVVPSEPVGVPTDSLCSEVSVVVTTDGGDLGVPTTAIDFDQDSLGDVRAVDESSVELRRWVRELKDRSRETAEPQHPEKQ